MQNVLITGCAGLLGSHFSQHLLNKGYRVIGVDDLSGGYEEFLPMHPDFHFFKVNLEDLGALKQVYAKYKPSYTYHFAAYAAEGLSPFIRKFNYVNNLVASANVVTQCIEHESKLIFTSSMAVYGEAVPPFTESMVPEPIDPYGIAKYAVEQDIKSAGVQFGMRWSIVRPHNVVGVGQNIWDRYRNVLGIFIRKALKGEPIGVYGDGLQKRAFSDIQFYMEPFEKLMQAQYDSETFNIGADHPVTIIDLAQRVKEFATRKGYEATIKHFEPRHEVAFAYCDHSKAESLLGFKDHTDLDSLIAEMFVWAEAQPERSVKNMEYELEKGLYSFWK